MTANKVIEIIDNLRPNSYDEEIKLKWISTLDGMVRRLVIQQGDAEPYRYPEDMEKELLIPYPFDNAYELYVEAMIDYYNREYDYYNNSVQRFEAAFSEFKKAYIRGHVPHVPEVKK